MGTYILRRLLLMIPTLIGITFLVFMLIALSPGGIGASLKFSGGQMEATSAALQEAYLEDRYGLDDPAVIQYVRWLERVSPVKFGRRDQVAGSERIRPPKRIKPPMLWEWYADELPEVSAAGESALEPEMTADEKARAWRIASNRYAQARAAFIAQNTRLEDAVLRYAREMEIPRAVDRLREPRLGVLAAHEPDRAHPAFEEVEQRGAAAVEAWVRAQAARADLLATFKDKPYPQAGVPIIPGVLSVGAPDFGVAFSKSRPVMDLIKEHLPRTLLLNLIAFPIIYLIAVPGGMLAATRQGSMYDHFVGVLVVALWSIPTVWAGVLAIGFLASKQYLGAFPVAGLHGSGADMMTFLPWQRPDGAWEIGFLLDTLWHLCLPVACLVYTGFAVLAKQTRAAMLDNFNADYVRTAKAKGVPPGQVVFRHVFRNSLLPIITMFATIFPAMLAGSVIIERIFSVPGMGYLVLEAINLRDRELILANTLMIAGVNLLALLLADILYALADPRITYD